MFKKIILLILLALPLLSCPFDEDSNNAVTIDAYKSILKSAKKGDFEKAKEEIVKQKELYEYFGKPLYASLLQGAEDKNSTLIKNMLDKSMVLEIKELLDKTEENFYKYKTARLLLIKAKKHLKVLTKDQKVHKLMRQLLKSLGNPGLMGMGKKDSDKEGFLRGEEELIENLTTLLFTNQHLI